MSWVCINPFSILSQIFVSLLDKVGDIEVASLHNSLQVKWSTLPSPDIDYYVVAYSIGDSMHGNLSLSGRDAISTPLLMIRDVANNTEYTVSVAAGVTVNKTINITGPWNTKSGMLVKSLLIV